LKPGRILHLWLPPVVFMAALFLYSSTAGVPTPIRLPDKLLHMAAYTLLGILFLRAFHGGIPNRIELWKGTAAVACTVAYGGLDEYHQRFVPGRVSDVGDFLADLAGALLAAVLLAIWIRYAARKP
jgi:VanZ family protein